MSAQPALRGRGVLVTRPRAQAATLMDLLLAQGAHPRLLALFEIRAQGDEDTHRRALADGRNARAWLFTSVNAVDRAAALCPAPWPALFAIGNATAQRLRALGHAQVQTPLAGATSEALLEHPALVDVAQRSLLICTGAGGRDVLAQTLRERGAQVQRLELYARHALQHRPHEVHEALHAVDAIVCTSGESLERLHALCATQDHARLLSRLLVVPSARVLELADRVGFSAVRVPAKIDDRSFVNCLLDAFEAPAP